MTADCPINLRLVDRLCVVVGAGRIGRHKAHRFLAAGARVRLIDPRREDREPVSNLEELHREYRPEDLEGAFLVVAASNRPEVNRRIASDARQRGLLVNVVDGSSASDFTLPALRQRGRLRLTVSTAGQSPALAALLADQLLESLEPGWDQTLELAGRLREWQLTHPDQTAYNRSILRQLIDRGLVELLSEHRYHEVDQLLRQTCGAGCSLAILGLNFPRDYARQHPAV